jgi:hypothetical protein
MTTAIHLVLIFFSLFSGCVHPYNSSEFSSTSKYLTHTPLYFILSSALIKIHHTHTHTHNQRNDEIKRRLYQLSKQFPADPATFLNIWRGWYKIAFQVICCSSRTGGSLFHAWRDQWWRSKCLVQPPDFLALTPKCKVTELSFVTYRSRFSLFHFPAHHLCKYSYTVAIMRE